MRNLVRGLALGRVAFGVLMLLKPEEATRAWIGSRAASYSGTQTAVRAFGARDLSLGAGALAALMAGERILVSSQFLADHVRATYAIDPSRIRLIRRGIDLRSFDPDRVRPDQLIELSRRWHIPDGVPLVMTLARSGGWSDVGVLLEALALVRHIKFRCLLIGADDDQAARPEI